MTNRLKNRRSQRRGAVTVYAAFMMVGLLAMVAFAVDLGYIMVAKAELQRTADAAAHAAAMKYASNADSDTVLTNVRSTARDYVALNHVLRDAPSVSLNTNNADLNGDIVVGKIDFANPSNPLTFGNANEYNGVRVRVQRKVGKNGEVPLFFARILGWDSIGLEASATAAMIRNVTGFKSTNSKDNVPILPIALSESHWNNSINNHTSDAWTWNDDGTVSSGYDNIPEVVIFPDDSTSGNYGTVNIGHTENSNSLLSGQIINGISQADIDFHGGELNLDGSSELSLSGDTGLDASLKDDLHSIIGKPRIIPLYSAVENPGANATYKITGWVGVRLMFVDLLGNDRGVVVQPADVKAGSVIEGDSSGTSSQIYSRAVLVQ